MPKGVFHRSKIHRLHISMALIGRKSHFSKWNKTHKGKNHPKWKGGRRFNSYGYILIHSPDHPYRNNDNCVLEHRLIMERKIGRYLTSKDHVHHINGNITDNRVENLELMTRSQHIGFHSKKRYPKYKNKLIGKNKNRDKITGRFISA